jgi:hypothetical protein
MKIAIPIITSTRVKPLLFGTILLFFSFVLGMFGIVPETFALRPMAVSAVHSLDS